MPSTTCGWCTRYANMTPVIKAAVVETPLIRHPAAVGAYRCDYCKLLSVATVEDLSERYNDADDLLSGDSGVRWYPLRVTSKSYPDVPEQIAAAASEAHECLSISAVRGAVALARAVVEASAKERGIAVTGIKAKIDAMLEQRLIREDIARAAHEVRLTGNEVAHGDLVSEPITQEDAEDTLALMDELLQELYQTPAIAARLGARRAQRRDRDA